MRPRLLEGCARQWSDAAKGVVFTNIEDETGNVNVIIWSKLLEKERRGCVVRRCSACGNGKGMAGHLVAHKLMDMPHRAVRCRVREGIFSERGRLLLSVICYAQHWLHFLSTSVYVSRVERRPSTDGAHVFQAEGTRDSLIVRTVCKVPQRDRGLFRICPFSIVLSIAALRTYNIAVARSYWSTGL